MPRLSALVSAGTLQLLSTLQPPIQTTEDLLSRDTVETANALKISVQELSRIKLDLVRKVLGLESAQAVGSTVWKSFTGAIPAVNLEAPVLRTSGIPLLDATLSGGFPGSSLVSIVGGTSSGKSYIAAMAASACALSGLKVVFISSTNDVNVKRIQTSMESLVRQNQNPSKPYTQAQLQDLLLFALSNVTVLHCYDLWALLDTVSKIADSGTVSPHLVVVDCMHHLIAPLMTAAGVGGSSGSAGLSRSTSTMGSVSSSNVAGAAVSASAGATSSGGGSGSGSGGAAASSASAAAPELLNSLLSQLSLLLRSLTAANCTVVLTNTPAAAGLLRRNSTVNGNTGSGGGASGAAAQGLGMGSALLDLVDIRILLERVERGDPGHGGGLNAPSGGGVGGNYSGTFLLGTGGSGATRPHQAGQAPAFTTIRAVVNHRPPYLKACPAQCEFVVC